MSRARRIEELRSTRAVFVAREAAQPGLWAEYIGDYDRMIARLEAGLPLTHVQRGMPFDPDLAAREVAS